MTGIAPAVVEVSGGNLVLVIVVALIALGALAMAAMFRQEVLAAGEGTDNMKNIAQAVQEGANAYLQRQFRTLGIFAAVAFFLLLALPADDATVRIFRSMFFLVGAGFSATVGYLGMSLAVRANLRVAAAAQTEGRNPAMNIGFRTGATVGMLTVGLGLLGASLVVILFQDHAPHVLEGFGFGAALLAMFMRVGGGIFTKAADVGADLVGKVEQNIPEDDPRNAATIADNVGDNVGDCAGMAADLFESYAVTLVAALILGSQAFGDKGLVFPLLVPAIGALTAVAGVYLCKPAHRRERPGHDQPGLLHLGRDRCGGQRRAGVRLPARQLQRPRPTPTVDSSDASPRVVAALAVLIGIVLASIILGLTGYFTGTDYRPVKDVGRTSLTGAATVILSGLSVGFESAVYTSLVIGAAVFGAFLIGGGSIAVALFAVALAGCGLLTTVGVIVAMDTFGPVSDNAQGIAEMSGDVDGEGAQILTELDAVGNTTKAITKGIAIATAVLAASALFGSYVNAWSRRSTTRAACAVPATSPSSASRSRSPSPTCWSARFSAQRWCSCSRASRSMRWAARPAPWSSRSAASSARSPGSWREPAVRSTAASSTSSPVTRCASSRRPGSWPCSRRSRSASASAWARSRASSPARSRPGR